MNKDSQVSTWALGERKLYNQHGKSDQEDLQKKNMYGKE